MDKINEVIALLTAIQNYAKDIHYNCSGEAFYSKHLLCDRVSENISDYIDSIKEVYFLHKFEVPLNSKKYLEMAIDYIPPVYNDTQSFRKLYELILKTLGVIQDIKDLSVGEENLFGNIAENLETSAGLLARQVLNG